MIKHKLRKGGSWNSYAWNSRSAYRYWDNRDDRNNSIGFRILKEINHV